MAEHPLADRVRPILCRRKGFAEKKMFGGTCFLLNGNVCVGTWKGSLVIRLDRGQHEATLKEPHTRPFDVTGRVMRGWALVDPAGIKGDGQLRDWVRRAANYVASLPAKSS